MSSRIFKRKDRKPRMAPNIYRNSDYSIYHPIQRNQWFQLGIIKLNSIMILGQKHKVSPHLPPMALFLPGHHHILFLCPSQVQLFLSFIRVAKENGLHMSAFVEGSKPTDLPFFASHPSYTVINAYSFQSMQGIHEPVAIKKESIKEKIRNDIIYTFYRIYKTSKNILVTLSISLELCLLLFKKKRGCLNNTMLCQDDISKNAFPIASRKDIKNSNNKHLKQYVSPLIENNLFYL